MQQNQKTVGDMQARKFFEYFKFEELKHLLWLISSLTQLSDKIFSNP